MSNVQVLALKRENHWVNVLTTIVETRKALLRHKFTLFHKTIINGQKLCLWSANLGPRQINKLKETIFSSKSMNISGENVIYDISGSTTSFLLQNFDYLPENMKSPIDSGCQIKEYWNTDISLKDFFRQNEPEETSELIPNLSVNIFKFYDRAGNVIVLRPDPKISFEIHSLNDQLIVLGTWMNSKFIPNEYIATIESWAYNEILEKRSRLITERWTDFVLNEPFEYINLEVFRLDDGQCVFSQKHISYFSNFSISTSVSHEIGSFVKQKIIYPILGYSQETQKIIRNSASLASPITPITQIRKERRNSLAQHFKNTVNRTFDNSEKEEAIRYFYLILKTVCDSSKNNVVYISDPYLFSGMLDVSLYQCIIKIFLEYPNITFRLLTHKLDILNQDDGNPSLKIFRSVKPKLNNVNIKQCSGNLFHDRWICNESMEIGISNSLNNFKLGVVFYPTSNHYIKISNRVWNSSLDQEEKL